MTQTLLFKKQLFSMQENEAGADEEGMKSTRSNQPPRTKAAEAGRRFSFFFPHSVGSPSHGSLPVPSEEELGSYKSLTFELGLLEASTKTKQGTGVIEGTAASAVPSQPPTPPCSRGTVKAISASLTQTPSEKV